MEKQDNIPVADLLEFESELSPPPLTRRLILLSICTGMLEMNMEQLNEEVREFCEERDWTQFHTPKELAIGLSTESNELLELFRFKSENKQEELISDSEKGIDVEEELADVLFFILRFADLYGIDLENALEAKLEKNRKKYPKDVSQSMNREYNW